MFAFLTAVVELVGLLLKSLIKSCRRRKNHQPKTSDASLQDNRENTECPNSRKREGSTVSKKPRRASVTERTVSTSERTVVFELEGSSSSPDTSTEKTTS